MINSHPSNYPKQTYAINFGYGPESKYLLKGEGREGREGEGTGELSEDSHRIFKNAYSPATTDVQSLGLTSAYLIEITLNALQDSEVCFLRLK